MDSKTSTIEALRAEWERARGLSEKTEMRAAAVAYCRLRTEQRASQEHVADELGLNRWTLAKWWQRSMRVAGSVGSSETGDALRIEVENIGPRSPNRRYSDELKGRVAEWARGERARGVGVKQISEQLGLPWESVSRWMNLRSAMRVKARPMLRQVEVVASRSGTAVPVLRSPSGFVIEGLDLAAMAELLKRIG